LIWPQIDAAAMLAPDPAAASDALLRALDAAAWAGHQRDELLGQLMVPEIHRIARAELADAT
jgi:hypothetical protein